MHNKSWGNSKYYFCNKKKLIAYDMGPANALIDDLSNYFYKKILIKMDYLQKKEN